MSDFYRDQRKVELRVGIIAVLCIIILIVGYAWLKNTLQLKAMTAVKIKFDNAQGIEIGDKVTVNGMETGRVTKIEQLNDGVLIRCQLKLKYPVREGARFLIQDSNLMGGKQLDIINFGDGKPIDASVVQTGESSSGMTALLSTASTTMRQLNILLLEINKPEGLFAQVKDTFTETKSTFGKVNDVIDDSRKNLTTALEQISHSTLLLNELVSDNKPNLDKVISMTPELMQKAMSTLDSLQAASTVLQSAVQEISTGEGTIPKLINDKQLYQNLLNSSSRMDSLLIDIKKNPTRYFKLRVF